MTLHQWVIMEKRRTQTSPREQQQLLALYVRELRRCKPMTREEEHVLATQYVKSGDPRLAQQLVAANLRLVVKIAMEYSRFHAGLLDLVQEGNLGLLEAVSRYDPTRGVRLASYAGWWIRAFILKHLLDTARLVRTGRSRAERRGFFHGQGPPADLSLDDRFGDGESSSTFLDMLQDHQAEAADDALEDAQLKAVLREHVDRFGQDLGTREAAVFRERLLAEDPAPRKDLAARFSLSRERVRQIEKGLLDKFRNFIAPSLGFAAA